MHPPTKNCCVVPHVVAHLKKTQGWNVAHTKKKGQSRRRHRYCLLCYCCSSTAAAMLLLLCYSHYLGLLCDQTVQIHHSYTCAVPAVAHKIYVKRRCWKNSAGYFLSTFICCVMWPSSFCVFYVYSSRSNAYHIILFESLYTLLL